MGVLKTEAVDVTSEGPAFWGEGLGMIPGGLEQENTSSEDDQGEVM